MFVWFYLFLMSFDDLHDHDTYGPFVHLFQNVFPRDWVVSCIHCFLEQGVRAEKVETSLFPNVFMICFAEESLVFTCKSEEVFMIHICFLYIGLPVLHTLLDVCAYSFTVLPCDIIRIHRILTGPRLLGGSNQ